MDFALSRDGTRVNITFLFVQAKEGKEGRTYAKVGHVKRAVSEMVVQ